MSAIFRNFVIEQDEGDFAWLKFSPHLEKVRKEGQEDLAAVLEDAWSIGLEFLSVFWGVFSEDTLFLDWHKAERLLPWANESPKNTVQLVNSIAASQTSADFDWDAWWRSIGDISADSKSQVEQIAVAGLLALDRFLEELLFRGNLRVAMRKQIDVYHWLTNVHAFLRERVLRSQSDVAVIAANARHAENRSMKKQVWEWYEANEQNYRSMDAAAEAIADKLVPVTFRTARGWIGECRKKMGLMHSARRL
jgi:hypothetical protein